MVVSKEYMQTKYGHLGKLVVVNKNGKNKTCIEMKCENCGVGFFRPAYAWNRENIFCSHKCNGSFYKTNATPIDEYILDHDGIRKPRIKCKSFKCWSDMMERATSKKFQSRSLTYKNCTVSKNFSSFDFFHNWCLQQKGYGISGYELDKDILIKGNKKYSENTCCFVPKEINMQFVKSDKIRGEYPIGVSVVRSTGKYITQIKRKRIGKYCSLSSSVEEAFDKYRQAKEDYIKYLADFYKGDLDYFIYDALYSYKVEITD